MDISPDFEQQLDQFLRLAGKQAFGNPTPAVFGEWFAQAVPKVLPALLEKIPADSIEVAHFLQVAGRSLYGELPMPAHGLQAVGQLKQGRNEPCACGSGRKFKHCCGAMAMLPLFGGLNLLRYVLDASPKSRLSSVAVSKASIDAVVDTAYQWNEEGGHARSAALLEPYFQIHGPLDARLAPLFNLLMDSWLALGHPAKRERLINEILLRGDRILRSDALQRFTGMLADRGDYTRAWRMFRLASELNPNDPALSFLEVTTLMSEGRPTEAQGRAQWWAAFLTKQRDPALADAIDSLREMAKDPHGGMMAVAMKANDHWRRLHELLLAAPAPLLRHHFDVFTENDEDGKSHRVAAELVPDAELARLEERWRQLFQQVKPALTSVHNDASEVWDNAAGWLDLLQQNTSLWYGFDVLDDLVMAVDTIGLHGVPQRLLVPIAERAAEQLRLTLESMPGDPVECHWGVWPNRPALRPVAHLAFYCKEAGNWERFMELAHWLVFQLNPNDNHGLRDDLSCAYVRFGRWADVLAVESRYGDGMDPTLTVNAVLATYAQGDAEAAERRLRQAVQDHGGIMKMLLQRVPPKPVPPDGVGILVGGKYEAWLYVSAMRPYWEQYQAIGWARALLAKVACDAKTQPPEQSSLF